MPESSLKDKFTRGPILMILAISGAFLFGVWRGPIVGLDTVNYVAGDIIRTPLYPIFLKPFLFLFGENWTRYTYLFQLALVLGACWSVARTLAERFFPGIAMRLFLLVILMTPVLGPNGIGNKYYSEALAYSAFLFTIHFFIRAMDGRRWSDVVLMFVCIILALLTRPQMFILCAAPGLLAVYFLLKPVPSASSTGGDSNGIAWKSLLTFSAAGRRAFLLTTGGLVLTILLSGLLARTYNYIQHDRFVSVPFTGMNLSTAILYVSVPEDAEVFEADTRERAFLETVLGTIDRGGHSMRHNSPPNFLALSNHYIASYNQVAWGTAYETYKKQFTDTPADTHFITADEFIELDGLLLASARALAPRHVPALVKLYASNILRGLGGYYYAAFLITVFLLALFLFLKSRDAFLAALITITTINFLNYALLGVLQMVMTRYTFYTDTLQLALLALWIFRLTLPGQAAVEREASASS